MTAITIRRRTMATWVPFAGIVMTIYAAWSVLIRNGSFERHPALLTTGAAVDLLGVVAIAYWLLVVRAGRARPRSLVSVIALSFVGARILLPAAAVERLAPGRLAFLIGDVALVAWAISRLRGSDPGNADLKDRIDAIVGAIVPNAFAARVAAAEMATLGYAFRRHSRTPETTTSFGIAPSVAPAMLWALVLVVAAETVPVHFLVAHWSARAAWIITALSIYSVIWLVGHLRSITVRRCEVLPERIVLRVGLRCDAVLAPADVTEVRVLDWRSAGALDRSIYRPSRPAAENILLTLRRPVTIGGTMGRSRRVTSIALRANNARAFADAITRVIARTVTA